MKPLILTDAVLLSGGTLAQGGTNTFIHAVTTDSRIVPAWSLFVALSGDRFDGHDFIEQAAVHGVVAVLIQKNHLAKALEILPESVAIIVADDTLLAMQNLAAGYRKLLGARVTAITGSNGKTSTKDFLRAILSAKYQTHATEGNFNNHIGLPLTIFNHEETHTHGVYEIGMNHPGEIFHLGKIACPDIAVVTTLGTAHIEFFGSAEDIAEEKLSIFQCLGEDGIAVINLESPRTEMALSRAPVKRFTVGIGKGDLSASDLETGIDGKVSFTARVKDEVARVVLPVPGEHMVQNALLAMAVGHLEGVPLAMAAAALAEGQLTKGRLQVKGWRGVTIIDDSYNANPDSMIAAMKTLLAQPSNARRFAVLGGMGELGTHSDDGHRSVGEYAAASAIDVVCTVGARAERIALAAGKKAHHFPDHASCAEWLGRELREGDVMLLKGSRSTAMEKVLQALEGEVKA